jgi:hypothetical protein
MNGKQKIDYVFSEIANAYNSLIDKNEIITIEAQELHPLTEHEQIQVLDILRDRGDIVTYDHQSAHDAIDESPLFDEFHITISDGLKGELSQLAAIDNSGDDNSRQRLGVFSISDDKNHIYIKDRELRALPPRQFRLLRLFLLKDDLALSKSDMNRELWKNEAGNKLNDRAKQLVSELRHNLVKELKKAGIEQPHLDAIKHQTFNDTFVLNAFKDENE